MVQHLSEKYEYDKDISEDDIIQHNNWYKKYIALKKKQEHALRYWRINKNGRERVKKAEPPISVKVEFRQKVDESIKLKILKWKEDRKKMHEETLQQQKYEQQKKEEQAKLQRKILENKKKIIVEQKREKESSDTALKMAQQAEKVQRQKAKSKLANMMLRKYRKKDMEIIQNAQNKKQSKLREEQEKSELFEQLVAKMRKKVRAGRDPIRLLTPTIEWRQKMKNNETEDFIPTLFEDIPAEITNIQHLAIPRWRKKSIENPPTTLTNSSM